MMPAPVLLIIGPSLAALITLITSRWQRATALAGFLAALVLWARLRAFQPLTAAPGVEIVANTWELFGRTLTMDAGTQALFLLLYPALGLLFLLSLACPWCHRFVPFALAVQAPLAAALMVRPVSFGLVSLLVAGAVTAAAIQAGRAGSTRAALRFLLTFLLAAPVLLVVAWMLESGQAAPRERIAGLILLAVLLLGAGFPFHIWVRSLVNEASVLATALVLGPVQLVVMVFALTFVQEIPWLPPAIFAAPAFGLSAAATVLIAGVLAITAVERRRLLGALVLLDMGFVLYALSLTGQAGWQTVVALHLTRFPSLLLAGAGLVLLDAADPRPATGSEEPAKAEKSRLWPLGALLFFWGCASLIGLPLTMGYSSHWALWAGLGAQSAATQTIAAGWRLALPLLGLGAAMLALLRSLLALLRVSRQWPTPHGAGWRLLLPGVVLAGLGASLLAQTLTGYAGRMAVLLMP